MPIDGKHRGKMLVGTKLVARYKGHDYECVVGQAEDGSITYDIAGEHFKSPSRAGTHVMGGIACNGWRFWSVKGSEEAEPKPKAAKPKAAKKTARKPKAERKPRAKKAKAPKTPNTPNTPEEALTEKQAEVDKEVAQIKGGFEHLEDGRYFCPGCMDSFAIDTDEEPTACPEGHTPIGVGEELAAVTD